MLEGRTDDGLAIVMSVVQQAPRAVYRGVQAWALADAGRGDEAGAIIAAHFADAVERQDRMGALGTVVHTRIAWGDMLGRRNGPGDPGPARTLLDEAKAAAGALGLPQLEARVSAYHRAHG